MSLLAENYFVNGDYKKTEKALDNFNEKKRLIKTSLQIKFERLLKKRFSHLFYENDKNEISLLKCTDLVERIRLFKNFEGSFCNSYLKKNFS